jgi:hypothetical protein
MAEKLSDKFRKSIEDSEFTDDRMADLYEAVEGMSDSDFKEYMYANRAYFDQNMSVAVDAIPGFRELISVEPDYGTKQIDYKKVTGSPDALDRFNEYTMKDMEAFGAKVGMTGNEFLNRMAQDKVKQDRERIAHGEGSGGWFDSPRAFAENLGGLAMNLLAPRTQEAIARGEDPQGKDYINDIAQDVLYAMPWGKLTTAAKTADVIKAAQQAKKFTARNWARRADRALAKQVPELNNPTMKGKLKDALIGASQNAITPTAIELMDYGAYGAYGDDQDNIRGKLNPIDILAGTGVNWKAGKLIEPRIEKLIGTGKLAGGVTTWLTNHAGDRLYGDRSMGSILGRALPGAGPAINEVTRALELDTEESKKQRAREKNEKKYKGKTTRAMLKGDKEDEE